MANRPTPTHEGCSYTFKSAHTSPTMSTPAGWRITYWPTCPCEWCSKITEYLDGKGDEESMFAAVSRKCTEIDEGTAKYIIR